MNKSGNEHKRKHTQLTVNRGVPGKNKAIILTAI
jgi:hypothetical protein